jgi:hypothetical protein
MADWRKLAMRALLADNQIDDREVAILRKEFFADKRIDRAELDFLLEAKKKAKGTVPAFNKLLFEAVRTALLADGKITAEETAWLRSWILEDGKVDQAEIKLLMELRLLADHLCPEFNALYNEMVGK